MPEGWCRRSGCTCAAPGSPTRQPGSRAALPTPACATRAAPGARGGRERPSRRPLCPERPC
eukprot:5194273-Alexandrium_andersonii.AAC.1